MEIAKYTLPQQAEIYLECFQGDGYREYGGLKELAKDKEAEAGISLRRLREYIAHNIHIELAKAPFDVKDGFLLKGVPSCDKCPKRTGNQPGLFDGVQEVKKGDTCTDPSCYQAKEEAFVELKAIEASKPVEQPKHATKEHPVVTVGLKTAGADLSQSAALKKEKTPAAPVVEVKKISGEYHQEESKKKGVLYPQDYNLAKPGCKKEVKAILVDGPKIGQVEFICDIKGCSNHGYTGSSSPRGPVTFEHKVQIWKQKVLFVYRDAALKATINKLPKQIGAQEANIVMFHLLKTLPHKANEKLIRVLGLDEKTDIDKYAKKLTGAGLMQFIVAACLLEDLGVDDLAWEREEGGLTKVAESYKVDTKKLLAEAKAELEKKRPKSDKEKEAEAKKDTAEVVKAHGKKVVKAAKKVMAKGKGKKKSKK
jgi:ParB family chromosome partitioning protein